ncbi:MAG: hypothetical protein GX464_13930, partial [Holophagae bacterium]|nr:hypothetical protein [Holophagae bacterium]
RLRLRAAAGARGLARLPSRIQELSERLRRLEALPGRLRALVQLRHRRLDGALSRLYHWPVRFGAPRRREVVTVRLAVAAERLRALVQRRRLELAGSERALAALSPANVLQRGFSITTREGDPTPLRDVAQVRAGEHLLTRLASGELRSLVLTRQGVTQPSLFMNGDSAGGARGPDPEEGGRQA